MSAPQTILVTGATGGIGRSTALHLARLGHRVFATGRREAALAELAAGAEGLALETLVLDVDDPASIDRAAAEVEARTDGRGLDVLVNNAGYGNMAPLELVSPEELRAQFQTNVFGLVAVTQRFLPAMRSRGAGKVINVSSVVGKLSLPLQGVYCATKHAVEALSDAWRMELRPFGIRVCLVEPGSIRTGFEATILSTLDGYRERESPYRRAFGPYQRMLALAYKRAPGPQRIARTIARVVRRRRPKARWVAPWGNRLAIFFAHLLPTRFMDWAMGRAMGLTRGNLRG